MKRRSIHPGWLMGWLCLALAACAEQELWQELPLTADQQALIGRAVNFDASYTDLFATRATGDRTGGFNQDDRMVIYRQYYEASKHAFDEQTEAFRTYKYDYSYAANTSIFLGNGWKVNPGRLGSDGRKEDGVTPDTFTQEEKDSLTWENGRTVRFRAWALSNLYGYLNNKGNWDSYYPDFSVSDWVTASGPTLQIPLNLKHVGCRICIRPKAGNTIKEIKICTDAADYRREDNAGNKDEDENDKAPDTEATARAAAVEEVYNRMCWPGGVDFDNGLKALPKDYVADHASAPSYDTIEQDAAEMIAFREKTKDDIASDAERPRFNNLYGYYYLVTIPYDMSSDGEASGQPIVLPSYTRFKVWLRDVNNGDTGSDSKENEYHLFCLNDIKDEEGNYPFADGLTLRGGYSYDFTVGYHYNKLEVTTTNDFSWTEKDATAGEAGENTSTAPEGTKFAWWKKGLDDAISDALGAEHKPYEPKFTLSTLAEVREFIDLVNGTAATQTEGLARARRSIVNEENAKSYYWWYRTPLETADTTWVKNSEAEAEGYVFYNKYVPSNGDVAAYSIEELLKGPYSFYDSSVLKRLKVTITADIDFDDLPMEGMTQPFGGYLDGGMKSLSNLNLSQSNGILFGELSKAAVTNLSITTLHPFGLADKATESVLAGISIKAGPCKALIQEATGASYVVGCIVEGENGQALVGKADNLTMMGCMQTMSGLGGGGALLGSYTNESNSFFAPQVPLEGKTVEWGRLMCCYYDKSRSPNAVAVGGKEYTYEPQQYVRGTYTTYLCAKYDHLLEDKSYYSKLTEYEKHFYYGLAPWKAMNSAIWYFNQSIPAGKNYPCNAHYVIEESGYNNHYPQLVADKPEEYEDVTKKNN